MAWKPKNLDGSCKLSQPFESMQHEYDVVVVGSGYGAGVAASRMARAGKSVAVLELGWERQPGSYPQTLFQSLADLHISGKTKRSSRLSRYLPSNATQLFQLVLGNGQHIFTAHGLGGCSLINSGVFLEADKQTLQMSPWPPEIRENPSAFQTYYSRAAAVLQPTVCPEIFTKTEHLRAHSPENFFQVPVTTFFRDDRNNIGMKMRKNTGSGLECTGLNDSSKNSVATTYLADAWNWGAEIFCGCKVHYVEQDASGKGHVIYFARYGGGREYFKDEFKHQLFWVKAKEFCFLGAGSLGTTEILLRSMVHGMIMSPLVGRNMSGNGDMLVFGYNGCENVNGIAGEKGRPGPIITGMIDFRKPNSLGSPLAGYVIEDGCIPAAFSSTIQLMLILQTIRKKVPVSSDKLALQLRKLLAALKSLTLGPYARSGAIQRTAAYLIMSHDSNEMTLTLDGDNTVLNAPGEGRSKHSASMKDMLNCFLAQTKAKMGHSYFYGREQEEVSVHPLGGANMSRNGTGREGVRNHLGEVYSGHGSEVYKGLVCCDASIVPTALGVNPLATITALAERSVCLLAKKYELSVDLHTQNGNLDANIIPRVSKPYHLAATVGQSIGWLFTEVLYGYISMELNGESFSESESRGKGSSCAMSAFLTIEICRNTEDESRPSYTGRCTGTVSCFALSKAPLIVASGDVEFFAQQDASAEATVISYSLKLISVEGIQVMLQGHKQIDSNISFSIRKTWEATTTVNVSINCMNGSNIGRGALHITLPQFARQVRTFRPTEEFKVVLFVPLLVFLLSFANQICIFFLRPFVSIQYPKPSTKTSVKARKHPSSKIQIKAKDGVRVALEIFELLVNSPKASPVLFLPGVTGVGAEHHIFALPYLQCNMVDYFTARGHRCYALTPRWGSEVAVAEKSVVYDCRLDVSAALNHIHQREARKPYVVAHCQGSVALGMGLLDGTISANQILGITANSVFMNEVFAYWNGVKGRTTLLVRLYELVAGNFFPVYSTAGDTAFQRLLDMFLRFYPICHSRDLCTSTACHRTSFGFGLLWNHDNLDRKTHDHIH